MLDKEQKKALKEYEAEQEALRLMSIKRTLPSSNNIEGR